MMAKLDTSQHLRVFRLDKTSLSVIMYHYAQGMLLLSIRFQKGLRFVTLKVAQEMVENSLAPEVTLLYLKPEWVNTSA
jgi:hypothetical protein